MAVLIDTNVLIFSIQPGHPFHEESIAAIERLLEDGQDAFVVPQNIAEFWNVCTRPSDKNGLGLSPLETAAKLAHLDSVLTLLYETPAVYLRWRQMVVEHRVSGVQVHDARLAAAMHVTRH